MALGLVLAACGGGRDTGGPTMEAAPVTTPTTGAGSTTLAGGAVDAPELAALDPFERWRLEALHGAGDVANVAAQAGTDLPLATASALADQAGRYFAARLTGTGRNTFPADWFDPADHYRDQAARVVAVGAAGWSTGHARTLVIWRDGADRLRDAVLWWSPLPGGGWQPVSMDQVPGANPDGVPD